MSTLMKRLSHLSTLEWRDIVNTFMVKTNASLLETLLSPKVSTTLAKIKQEELKTEQEFKNEPVPIADTENVWTDLSIAKACFDECGNGKISQQDVYIRLKAPPQIMDYVNLSSKPFGSRMEFYIPAPACSPQPHQNPPIATPFLVGRCSQHPAYIHEPLQPPQPKHTYF